MTAGIFKYLGKSMIDLLVAALAALWIGIAGSALAAPTATLDESVAAEYPLGVYLEILEDPEGDWTVNDVSSPEFDSRFRPIYAESLSLGYTESAYWVRFKVFNPAYSPKLWFLEESYPLLDRIDLYEPTQDEEYILRRAGDTLPFSKRDLEHKNFIFRLIVPAGETQTYYMRFETSGSMTVSLSILSPEKMVTSHAGEQIVQGLFYGTILAMALYNLFLFFSVRDRNYLYYVLYLAIYLLFQSSYSGLAYQYLWPTAVWWHSASLLLFTGLLCVCALQFSRSFLALYERYPLLDKISVGFILASIASAAASFFLPYATVVKPLALLAVSSIVFIFVSGSFSLFKKNRTAKIFMVAWTLLLLGFLSTALKNLGVLPHLFITEYGMQIGSVAEALLLSLALADRINMLREEKDAAQTGALLAERNTIETLHESEERFRKLFDSAFDGLMIHHYEKIVEVNDGLGRLFSYTVEEMTGKSIFHFIAEESRPMIQKLLEDSSVRASAADGVHEIVCLKKDGTPFFAEIVPTAQMQFGKPIRAVGVRDVTNRKMAEQMKDEFLLALEQRVEVRTLELNESNLELKNALDKLETTQKQLVEQEKMAALGALVAGMAHEINTPVGIGVTAVSHFERETGVFVEAFETGRMTKSSLRKYIDIAGQSASLISANLHRAGELIQSFKMVAVDQSSEKTRTFEAGEYVGEILLSLRPELKKTEHTIERDFPEKIELHSYPGEFSQVIANLVMNSIKHAYNNNDRGRIKISGRKNGASAVFTYSDDGAGISEENLGKIFDPFFTTQRNQGGTGLGLHVVYNIVTQKLKGAIDCRSVEEKGTEFTIKIPLLADP